MMMMMKKPRVESGKKPLAGVIPHLNTLDLSGRAQKKKIKNIFHNFRCNIKVGIIKFVVFIYALNCIKNFSAVFPANICLSICWENGENI